MHGPAPDQRIGWRYATAADIEAYYGETPAPTMRAVVILMGTDVAAVLGVARHQDHAQFFSEFREALRPYLRTLPAMRAIKQAQQLVREARLPVFARAEQSEKDAVRLLTRLGFVHHDGDTFRWPNSPT